MKKLVLIILIIVFYNNSIAQNQSSVTIDFNDIPLKEALLKLESQTGYHFYFQEEWFANAQNVTEHFDNASLNAILENILKESLLNFLIYDNSIILTKNSFVYSELPKTFFNEDLKNLNQNTYMDYNQETENESEDETNAPVLQKQYDSHQNASKTEFVTIGKANTQNSKGRFQISGIVKDFVTGKPIPDLLVTVRGSKTNAVTNENGYFSFKLPQGSYIIETKSLGYQPLKKNVAIYGEGTLNFEVLESVTQLTEVLIESNRDYNIKETMAGITSIDVKEIKTVPLVLGERDVLKVATTMPGIKSAGEGSLGFNVRGGKTDQNLILLDNAVMYNPSHFFGIFSAINPFTTGNVKIYKGSIPAEYGGRLSSVIDISTKDSNVEKFSGEGSIGPVTGNLSVETPIVKDKSSIMVGARATYSNWLLRSLDDDSFKKSQASFYDGILKYNVKINENNDIRATVYYSKDKFSITSDSIFQYDNRLASLEWNHTFNEKNRGTLHLVNSQYKFKILYDSDFNTNFDYDYTINESQLKFNMKYLFNKQHKFDYGLSAKIYAVEPGAIKPLNDLSDVESKTIEKERAFESALYLSDLFEVSDKLSIDIGLRYSFFAALGGGTQNVYAANQPKTNESVVEIKTYGNNEVIKTYGGFEPRLSARYFLSPTLSIKGGYNRTIQYIHLLSSNTTQSPVDSWKLSDLNIEPQKANQFSFGIFKNFSDDLYEASIETYYKRMKDILDFKIGAQLSLNENIETEVLQGQVRSYGIELLLRKKKGRLNGWVGYSYSRSKIKLDSQFLTERVNNGEYFPSNYDRPHDFNVVSNFKLTERYSFSMNFNYQTGRPLTYPVGKFIFNNNEQVIYSDRNAERIPDYFRLDLGLNIEGNHKKMKLAHSFINISVYNVLGRSNPYSVYFVNEDGGIKAFKTSIFAIPIPTITYNFKF